MTTRQKLRAAFTLTEAAVVLGVAGLVIGSIWTAAGSALDKFKSQKMTQQIGTIVQNISNLFPSGTNITPTDSTFQSSMIKSGVVPPDMIVQVSGASAIHTAYGTGLIISSNAGDPRSFGIQISYPYTDKECIAFISSIAKLNSQLIEATVDGSIRLPDSECLPDEGFPPPCYSGTRVNLTSVTPVSSISGVCHGNAEERLSTFSRITLK